MAERNLEFKTLIFRVILASNMRADKILEPVRARMVGMRSKCEIPSR
jgi:hypothetical protein